jgi:hypothetical protein
MAHAKEFRFWLSHGFLVEAHCTTMEPIRPRLLVVPEWQPQVLELADFLAVLTVAQVDDVRDAQRLEFFYMAPCGYCAAKRQPLAYPKHLHACAPFVRT